jgi:hypothetical protein
MEQVDPVFCLISIASFPETTEHPVAERLFDIGGHTETGYRTSGQSKVHHQINPEIL